VAQGDRHTQEGDLINIIFFSFTKKSKLKTGESKTTLQGCITVQAIKSGDACPCVATYVHIKYNETKEDAVFRIIMDPGY
jgi:hypothetical protein